MSQVNLLPPEIRQAEQVRRQTTIVALVGLVVLVAIGFFYFLQTTRLSDAESRLQAQQDTNQGLQTQIADLQRFADLRVDLQRRRALVDVVLANEVSWSGVLLDVSRVIPNVAYLENLTAALSVQTGVAEAPAAGEADLVGNMQFQGQALDEETLAVWLTRLEQVRGWVNPWLSNASETGPRSNIYTFSSSVDLSPDVVTERGRAGQEGAG